MDNWNFDMFSFARAAKGSPLKFMGKFDACFKTSTGYVGWINNLGANVNHIFANVE